jgi:D-arabinose 1-dehydrogenase-like Zn-dependent alcohol dehydrogenase
MGCSVTVISNSSDKRSDAFKLGADEFRDLSNLSSVHRPDDVAPGQQQDDAKISALLLTSNAIPELTEILPLLARHAPIVLMTIQQDSISIPYMPFVLPGHRLIASTEASRENHIRMLDFAARHGVVPWIESFEMNAAGIRKAFQRLESGEMRFRGVLVRQEGPLEQSGAGER